MSPGKVVLLGACFVACSVGSSSDPTRPADPSAPDPSGDTGAGRDGSASAGSDGRAQPSDGRAPGSELEPGPPHVQLIGRFDQGDARGATCAFPGCRIVARFQGTSVSVRMNEIDAAWMEGAPSEWDATIDDEPPRRLVMQAGESTYVLAEGLPDGIHVVELYKRSEAQNGSTQLLGFDFGDGELLAPPARKQRRIEIIGDSAAAGFGIEGVGLVDPQGHCPGIDWSSRWQNFHKSFGAVLGELLDAEVYGTVYSGKGIAQNIWPTDLETLPIVFARTLPVNPKSTWDSSRWRPQLVVVMAGGNDFAIGQPVDMGPASLEDFTGDYRSFVATIRRDYPDALVVLTISPSVSDEQPPGRKTRTNVSSGVDTVVAERVARGDRRVVKFAPKIASKSELTACNGHGDVAFHQRVASEIAAFAAPKLGW